jgi:hypothetical protein
MDRSESSSFTMVDLDDAPAELHGSPFARIGESLFRRGKRCLPGAGGGVNASLLW